MPQRRSDARDRRLDEMAWRNIGLVRGSNDEAFARNILEARRDFLNLRLKHEPAIRQIYVDAANQVASELSRLTVRNGSLTRNHMAALENSLRAEAEAIKVATTTLMQSGIQRAVIIGGSALDNHILRAFREVGAPLNFAKVQRGFADVNTSAVEAMWARTRKGLTVSDRIWNNADTAREAMRDITQAGIAQGRDVVKVARDLEKYVQQGAKTLAKDYPNMMRRMGTRVPKDVCYEALRLARTEYSMAAMEGTYSRGRVNPSYRGVRFMLSDAHPEPDICDSLAEADLYDMGKGVYKRGEEPTHPHPNCLCFVTPHVTEREEFLQDLRSWLDDPSSVEYMEAWYNEVYRAF